MDERVKCGDEGSWSSRSGRLLVIWWDGGEESEGKRL